MPKAVKLAKGKEFHFKAAGGGQPSKYNWDEWFNGSLLMLERSVVEKDAQGNDVKDANDKPVVTEKRDYDVETNFMPGKLKAAARKRYKVVQISRLDPDGNRLVDALIIKARDMDANERAAEDLLRAEEKEARKNAGKGTDTTPAIADGTAEVA